MDQVRRNSNTECKATLLQPCTVTDALYFFMEPENTFPNSQEPTSLLWESEPCYA
jgi:hypothetical protein